MVLLVKLVRGRWVKNEMDWWVHEPDLGAFEATVSLREHTDLETMENMIKGRLGVRAVDGVEITYQWPPWMLGPDWPKAVPIYITDDEEASLFMAIRADLEELFLRVRVIPYSLERNVNSYSGSQTVPSPSMLAASERVSGYGGNKVIEMSTQLPGSSSGYIGATDVASSSRTPSSNFVTAATLHQSLRYVPTTPMNPLFPPTGYYRPVSNGGIIWPGVFDPTIIGDPPMQFVEYDARERAIMTWQMLAGAKRQLGEQNAEAGEEISGGGLVTPVISRSSHGKGQRSANAVRDCETIVDKGQYSQNGDSVNVVGKDTLATAVNQTTQEQTEICRSLPGGTTVFEASSLGKGATTPEVERGVEDMVLETDGEDNRVEESEVELQLTLAGSYVGSKDSAQNVPMQPSILNLSSTDTSSPSLCSSTELGITDEENDMEEDDEGISEEEDINLCVSLEGEDMTPRQYTASVPMDRVSERNAADALNEMPTTAVMDKSIDKDKGKGIALDKGKGIAVDNPISVPHRQTNETLNIGGHARVPLTPVQIADTAEEIRIMPMLHSRDAPPYYDDPIGEDELDRALRDVDYEGDDIYVKRIFKNVEDCRMKLAIHAINRRFHFRYVKSCPEVVLVVCVGDGCPWRVYTTVMDESDRYEVRTANLQHTCNVDARGNFHRQASTGVIGNMMRSRYTNEGRGPRAFELRRILRQEFSLHVSYWKAWRAREIALDNAMGSAMGSFALIPPYFNNLLQSNPNSIVSIETEIDNIGKERFKYLFFSLDACAKGYQYMRKVIVIDGTHLSGRYGGCLVAASAQDGNFQVFPLAFGIVNSENDDAWTWFLSNLAKIVPDDPELVFVSDRHAAIYAGIRNVYPMSSHAACIVHLVRNIQNKFKTPNLGYMVSEAGRAFRLVEFEKLFADIRAADSACAEYLTDLGFEHWTRSHFIGDRYNVMSSNVAESLNNVLTMARDFPIISILETIRTTLVTWFALRRESAASETSNLTPKVEEMVIQNFEKSCGYFVMKIGDGIYEVRDEKDVSYAVHLWERTCTCREFQLLQIPCKHAIAAAIQAGVPVDSLAGSWYTLALRRMAYDALIMPVPDMDQLAPSATDIGGGKLAPPSVRRPPGRPRKERIPSRGEFKRVSRRKCTRCRGRGHNKSTCKVAIQDP